MMDNIVNFPADKLGMRAIPQHLKSAVVAENAVSVNIDPANCLDGRVKDELQPSLAARNLF